MPGLVPGIHGARFIRGVDGRDVKFVLGPAEGRTRGHGHDALREWPQGIAFARLPSGARTSSRDREKKYRGKPMVLRRLALALTAAALFGIAATPAHAQRTQSTMAIPVYSLGFMVEMYAQDMQLYQKHGVDMKMQQINGL